MFFLAKLKSTWYSFVFPFVLIFLSLLCEGCGGGGGGGGGVLFQACSHLQINSER